MCVSCDQIKAKSIDGQYFNLARGWGCMMYSVGRGIGIGTWVGV